MVENIQNNFEGYIGLFIFYIIPINYAIFMGQILIFEPNWDQNIIIPNNKSIKNLLILYIYK